MLATEAGGTAAAGAAAGAAEAITVDTQWDTQFALDLVTCIREVAAEVSSYTPPTCATAEEVLDERAELLGRVLAPYLDKHGQAATLWCTFYATPQYAAPMDLCQRSLADDPANSPTLLPPTVPEQ